jgi:putative lipoic acid-binding regulatory protein
MTKFDAVKVFSATKAKDREELGESITRWINAHPNVEIVDKVVSQSSDSEYHCLSITIFFRHLDPQA